MQLKKAQKTISLYLSISANSERVQMPAQSPNRTSNLPHCFALFSVLSFFEKFIRKKNRSHVEANNLTKM
uniref:Ovule protein n=1 Tax=Romanomermis culicivorax TaxID=13658 RepID=A0A915HU27_ROMCU